MKFFIKKNGMMAGLMVVGAMVGAYAGELTVDGGMVVKTNLTVNGQLSCNTIALSNLTIRGEASFDRAVIHHLEPQGDLGMGPYTNGVGH